MDGVAPARIGHWFAGKVIPAYLLVGLILCGSAGVLRFAPAGALERGVFALAPGQGLKGKVEGDRAKFRDGIAKLPAVFFKLGLALLGVAALARLTRAIESKDDFRATTDGVEASGVLGKNRAADWAFSGVLAALVFAQMAPWVDRPLVGDELENYEQHLRLPLSGTLTTMGRGEQPTGVLDPGMGQHPAVRRFADERPPAGDPGGDAPAGRRLSVWVAGVRPARRDGPRPAPGALARRRDGRDARAIV